MSKNTSKKPPPLVRWWFSNTRDAVIVGVVLLLTVVLYFLRAPATPSPLIASYLDLLSPDAAWVIEYVREQSAASFFFSFAFDLSLILLLLLTFLLCKGSDLTTTEVATRVVVREFGWSRLWKEATDRTTRYAKQGASNWSNTFRANRGLFLAIFIFLVMLISNSALYSYYAQLIEGNEDVLTKTGFRVLYFIAIVSRLAGFFLGFGTFIRYFLEDFGSPILNFFRQYGNYFYPALISIGIVSVVFTKMDQFDGLFIELVRSPGNFLLFSIFLFPASVIIIWFAPSYLAFSDQQFSSRQKSWDIINRLHNGSYFSWRRPHLFYWLFLHKRAFSQLDTLSRESPPPGYLSDIETDRDYPPVSFHRFRAFLGMFYILTLIGLCADIYFGNRADMSAASGAIVPLVGFGVLLYTVLAMRSLNIARRRRIREYRIYREVAYPQSLSLAQRLRERAREKRNRHGDVYLKRTDWAYFVSDRNMFWTGLASTLIALALFLATLVFSIKGAPWHQSFLLFLCFLIVSIFAFSWLTVYLPFFQSFTFNRRLKSHHWPTDRMMDWMDYFVVQVMLLANPILVICAGLFFLVGFSWGGFVSSPFIQGLNPLNIYLLLINGVIASIILVDRYLLLRDRYGRYLHHINPQNAGVPYQAVSAANFFWGAAIIIVLLATAYLGNSYHEITYTSTQNSEAPDLRDFTKTFLDNSDDDQPIILVAADGGGLKACYWTMLNLEAMEEDSLFDGQVFALSGASGGTIGISMYTFLRARKDLSPERRRQLIDSIGSTNFLAGDFAGLLTRFPHNYWPDLPGLEPWQLEDRQEGMARAYLNIVGERQPGWTYDEINEQPFWHIWKDQTTLPLMIVNTANSEDGRLGTVFPLRENPVRGTIDLTRKPSLAKNRETEVISYPQATFLSNRFPVASPAARIPGKGHFVDAGTAENSGISSLYYLLQHMKARSVTDTVFQRFFDRTIVLISMRNAASRFVRDKFLENLGYMNRYPYISELSATTNAALNSGMTGIPIRWDDYLRDTTLRGLALVDTFMTINLPFRLNEGDITSSLGGEIALKDLGKRRDNINREIHRHLGPDSAFIVLPPLGRLLAEPTRSYMKKMVRYPDNRAVLEAIKSLQQRKKKRGDGAQDAVFLPKEPGEE
ncbi:hypothetical protein [Lewinella sp. W8]|uniref:hypothetical protein n=1 Tax=Lewinella sp. W8 TaxID=2528208 RepID=UPI0010674183|nr:hypothetical protein [Lewinella sp. W8]MTB53552.1 hypothetical protein [Lewinella sp. W8]